MLIFLSISTRAAAGARYVSDAKSLDLSALARKLISVARGTQRALVLHVKRRSKFVSSVKVAVYPGTFDPITLGHLNIIERASRLFDKLIVAVGVNSGKSPWFTAEERCEMIRQSVAERALENVEATLYQGLTVRFAKRLGARVMVRGVRPLTDLPAELTLMMANRQLEHDVETLFLVADGELAHVSSSLIKEIACAEEDAALNAFLPMPIIDAVRRKAHERLVNLR